jgi:signal peptidase II
MTVVFTVVAVAVAAFILRIAGKLRSKAWAVALGLVLGGAMGNLADRVFREPAVFRGHVIDFLELPHWPVFNIADSCIVSGGLLMVLLSVLGVAHDGAVDHAEPT